MAKAATKPAAKSSASSSQTRAKTDSTESWVYDGDIHAGPEWIDRGWAAYDGGPALAVPNGDPNGQPYTTTVARKGDTIVRHKAQGNLAYDSFKVVRAEEIGGQPGGDPVDPSKPTFRPGQESNASLEDMARTGILEEGDDEDAEAQLDARKGGGATMSAEERKEQEKINLERENRDQGGAPKNDSSRARTST